MEKETIFVVVDHEEDAVTIIYMEIKDLMLAPGDPCEFVTSKRRMSPIGPEKRELFARHFLDFRWKVFEFAFEPHGSPEDHSPFSKSSGESNSSGSMASFLCCSTSAKSLAVGFRTGTVAANRTESNGISASLFFNLAFIS
jgi:hypothetical protein